MRSMYVCVKAWANVCHVAIPRNVMEDDVYRGYQIPRSTMVIPNLW